MKISNKIQLITYPDSLGKNLKDLHYVLNKYFKGYIKGVHVLPFFSSSGDRGFAPLTYQEVDPKFGNWEDISSLAKDYELMADLMVNHISSQSKYFQGYLEKGDKSQYADYFITSQKFSRRINSKAKTYLKYIFLKCLEFLANTFRQADFVFHKDGVNRFTLKKIYRPRPGSSPFLKFRFKDGKERSLFCTFSRDQIDLDVKNKGVRNMFKKALVNFSEKGIKIVRFDAVGYAVKKRGTSNFMIPEVYQFMTWIAGVAHKNELEVLPEVHRHYKDHIKLSQTKGIDYVYDFSLSFLVLQALYTGTNDNLINWIKIRPQKTITTLDTHDGLPVPDVEGLMTQDQINRTVQTLHLNGGNNSFRASGANADNVDLYQVNCTYYSALGENDDAYLAARTIQFFLPGIPQVYYVGLLAGENDVELFERTNHGRDINRHSYSLEEIDQEVKKEVVGRLLKLMKFRNDYPAFSGEFSLLESSRSVLRLRWDKEDLFVEAKVDLKKYKVVVRYRDVYTKEEKMMKV